jgi:hypothetical protein
VAKTFKYLIFDICFVFLMLSMFNRKIKFKTM